MNQIKAVSLQEVLFPMLRVSSAMFCVSSALVLCGCLFGTGCGEADSSATAGSGGKSASGGASAMNRESSVVGTSGSSGAAGHGGSAGSGGKGSSSGSAGSGGRGGTSGGMASSGGKSGSGGTADSGVKGGSGGTVGKDGSPGSDGAAGNGGKDGGVGTAGNSGPAGSSGKGGSGGSAGSSGKGDSGGSAGSGGGSGTSVPCTFTQSSSTSPKIATVGIVKWSTTLSGLSSAHIDFGLDKSYGMTAPVDSPISGTNTTLLLGMKASKTYHYRIIATSSNGYCTSPDYTIATGALANGLPTVTVKNNDTSALSGGFLITAQYMTITASSGSPAYILDADGEMVWAYDIGEPRVTGAQMSYDGTHMWINTVNVPSGPVYVHRVTMDGTKDEDLSGKFAGLNHQLTVLPDETIAFYAYSWNGCEDIKEYSPSGTVKTIVNAGSAQGGASACHVNNIQYSKFDDALIFSDLDNQSITKVKRSDGSTVWTINGSHATLTGECWKGSQHGIHPLGLDDFNQEHILFFNNNSRVLAGSTGAAGGTGKGSIALEIKLDLSAKTITKVWSFQGAANLQNDIMGDVQRLANGNTIVAFSIKGAMQEVDAGGSILSDWNFPLAAEFGYIEKRATLYGPPPR